MTGDSLTYFGKRESTLMSGVAIVFMLVLHFWGHDEWLLDGVEWRPVLPVGNCAVECIVSRFGGFCVHIFAFISGYVMWKRPEEYTIWQLRFMRLAKFLVCYWVICILFWLYAVAIGDTLPPFTKLLQNLVGLELAPYRPYVNVAFAWYVNYYICLVAASPLLLKMFSKGIVGDVLALSAVFLFVYFVMFVPYVVLCQIKYNMWPFVLSAAGLLSAKYAVFESLKKFTGRTLPCSISVSGIVLIILLEYNLLKMNVDTWGG